MKKLIYLLLLPFIAFVACDDDDDDYSLNKFRVDIATVENPDRDANFFLRLDNGKRLWIGATNYSNYRPQTGQRILADYTILGDGNDNTPYDYNVRLNDAYDILTKEIITITDSNEDEIGNDRIGIHDMWIGGDYMNVRFYYSGYNKTHFINMVIDKEAIYIDDKIHLEFRHNANSDASTYRYNGIASFSLLSLLEDVVVNTSSVDIVVHVREFDKDDEEYKFTYKFNEDNSETVDFDREDFSEHKDNDVK